jgi:hypothetical protein
LRMLAQPMLTSGAASLYDVAVLYSTNSVRQIKDTFKRLKEQNDAMQQQQQALEQQKIEQTQAQFEETMKKQEALKREEMINDNYQNELDRLNKKEIAIINSFNRQDDNLKDADSSGVPDILEISRLAMDREAANKNHNTTLSKLNNERIKEDNKMKIEMEKLKQEKEKLKQEKELKLKELETQLTVAKYRDLGTKNSPKSSSKKKSK